MYLFSCKSSEAWFPVVTLGLVYLLSTPPSPPNLGRLHTHQMQKRPVILGVYKTNVHELPGWHFFISYLHFTGFKDAYQVYCLLTSLQH